MKKRCIVILAVIIVIVLRIAFPFLQAAHQMKVYLRAVNPHFAPYAKIFAGYNPVGGEFYMRITDNHGDSISLECVSDGKIIDEPRTDEYLENNNISTRFVIDETRLAICIAIGSIMNLRSRCFFYQCTSVAVFPPQVKHNWKRF